MQSKLKIYRMILAALFLALAMVLPLLTGQLPQIGNALCPMHIPVLLCGFLCGPWYAMAVGFVAPLLRFLLFGSPVLMPIGISMCFELLTYGAVAAWLYRSFPKKKAYIYSSLITAMIAGRVVWGIARAVLYGLGKASFSFAMFISGGFVNAVPGIILQLVLIPLIVMAFNKYSSNIQNGEINKQ